MKPFFLVFTLLAFLSTAPAQAMRNADLGETLKNLMPADGRIVKKEVTLSARQAAKASTNDLKFRAGDRFTLYISQPSEGKPSAAALVVQKALNPYGSIHRFLYVFNADSTIRAAEVLEISDSHLYACKIRNAAFLGQFIGKDLSTLSLDNGIDAVSGATDSSRLFTDNARRAQALVRALVFKL